MMLCIIRRFLRSRAHFLNNNFSFEKREQNTVTTLKLFLKVDVDLISLAKV